jgi:hypothetical protein
MKRKLQQKIYNSGYRNCSDHLEHNKYNHTHGITQMLRCAYYNNCMCQKYEPKNNLEYLEYRYDQKIAEI